MSHSQRDVIVIGGGHNGLVTAGCLARAGLDVTLCEAARRLGGGASVYEIHPEFKVPALAHVPPPFDPRALRALKLGRRGWKTAAMPTSVALDPAGGALQIGPDAQATAASLKGRSSRDAAKFADAYTELQGHAAALRPLLSATPPRLDPARRGELLALGRLGWSIRRRGRDAMRELLRIITMDVAGLLEEKFENDLLRGAFALDAVLGTDHGPRSPNTVFTLLHRLALQQPGARTRPATTATDKPIADTLADAARAAGVQILTDARVARVQVDAGASRGVELSDGRVLEARTVISNADPVTTFADLVGGDHLDADFLDEVRCFRTCGTTGKVSFALERLPDLPLPSDGGPTRWLLAPSMDYVETAFDHVKYGEAVPEPALEITIPSLDAPGRAPDGRHVMSVNVAYAPYSSELDPSELGATVTRQIEGHVPGFAASVLACEAWGPRDIEARFGNRGGHWHHGDIALDQFFMVRPVPGFAQYRTPVDGLYLCGAGTHPGGGVTGTNGYNAARAVLRDRRRRRTRHD